MGLSGRQSRLHPRTRSRAGATVEAHDLTLGEDMAVHGGCEVLLGLALRKARTDVESIDADPVLVPSAGRTGAAVVRVPKVVQAFRSLRGQFAFGRRPFAKFA